MFCTEALRGLLLAVSLKSHKIVLIQVFVLVIPVAMGTDPSQLGKYIAGYNECTSEISKYLNTVDGLSPETRTRLMNHLANSLQRSSITMAANSAVTNLQFSMGQSVGGGGTTHAQQPLGIQIPAATQLSALPGSGGLCVLNQGTTPQIQTMPTSAMQLVPAKLPSGELVFLLANQQTISPTTPCPSCRQSRTT